MGLICIVGLSEKEQLLKIKNRINKSTINTILCSIIYTYN